MTTLADSAASTQMGEVVSLYYSLPRYLTHSADLRRQTGRRLEQVGIDQQTHARRAETVVDIIVTQQYYLEGKMPTGDSRVLCRS